MKLEISNQAPDFKGVIQNGNTVNLTDFTGKKLILFFYPKDNTPGCTAEACNLSDNYQLLKDKGFELLGVSPDTEVKHQNFIAKKDLKMDLIADPEKKILESYGVWGEKKLYGRTYMGVMRTTFIIDENGIIEKIFPKVKTKAHTEQILESYQLD